ncbi:MAG: hypothetical protein QW786_00515, partial [Candidatus Hadarchaeum sp.]
SRFVSIADWPAVDVGLLDKDAEFAESFLLRVLEDVGKIIKVMRKEPKKLCLYVAPEWKWRAFQIAVEHSRAGAVDFGKLMKDVEGRLDLSLPKSDLAKCLQQMVQEIRKMPQQELDVIASKLLDELQVLKEAADFIRGEFGLSQVQVFGADDEARYDPQNRAKMSLPLRPAIYLE